MYLINRCEHPFILSIGIKENNSNRIRLEIFRQYNFINCKDIQNTSKNKFLKKKVDSE
jgi:hypothetical protein